jgi:hypothetical protein
VSTTLIPTPEPELLNGDFEVPALSEFQTFQNFASGQTIRGWNVSSTLAACFDQANKSLQFPENPQCYVSLERNLFRRKKFWQYSGDSVCSIHRRLESSICSPDLTSPSFMHFSGFQSVVIPMGMSISTIAANLIPGLHYQLSFAAGMSLHTPIPVSDDVSEFVLSLRVLLTSEELSSTETVVVTRMSGMSSIFLPPFVATTSKVAIYFEVLLDTCYGECNFVRLDHVVLSLYSNGDPSSIVRVREILNQVTPVSSYKADGLGVAATYTGVSFDFRFAGHGSKVYFPQARSNSTVVSIVGCRGLCNGWSSSSLVFPDSPSWPYSPSDFSSLGLLSLEIQPSLLSSSGSCFLSNEANTFLVTVLNGN